MKICRASGTSRWSGSTEHPGNLGGGVGACESDAASVGLAWGTRGDVRMKRTCIVWECLQVTFSILPTWGLFSFASRLLPLQAWLLRFCMERVGLPFTSMSFLDLAARKTLHNSCKFKNQMTPHR